MSAPRIEVVGGGEPSSEELAAVVLALTPVAGPTEEAPEPRAGPSAWRRAALLEGVGGAAAVVSAADLGARQLR